MRLVRHEGAGPGAWAGAEMVHAGVSAPGLGTSPRSRLRARCRRGERPRGETVKTVTVVQHHTTEVPVASRPGSVAEFVDVLADLTRRVDSGRVYDRDLPTLTATVRDLVEAIARREKTTHRSPW